MLLVGLLQTENVMGFKELSLKTEEMQTKLLILKKKNFLWLSYLQELFLFSKIPRPAREGIHLLIQWVPVVFQR
jgi:hypothetical protein